MKPLYMNYKKRYWDALIKELFLPQLNITHRLIKLFQFWVSLMMQPTMKHLSEMLLPMENRIFLKEPIIDLQL